MMIKRANTTVRNFTSLADWNFIIHSRGWNEVENFLLILGGEHRKPGNTKKKETIVQIGVRRRKTNENNKHTVECPSPEKIQFLLPSDALKSTLDGANDQLLLQSDCTSVPRSPSCLLWSLPTFKLQLRKCLDFNVRVYNKQNLVNLQVANEALGTVGGSILKGKIFQKSTPISRNHIILLAGSSLRFTFALFFLVVPSPSTTSREAALVPNKSEY